MKLFNLTDRLAPGQKTLNTQTLKRPGVTIEPGKFAEVPDDLPLGYISGWLNGGLISINNVPHWYALQVQEEKRAKIEARNKSFAEEGETSKKSRKSKKRNK